MTIRTPHGDAPEAPEIPPNAVIGAVCGDMELLDAELRRVAADVAHQAAEISLAIAEICTLRRRVAALERREPRRRDVRTLRSQ